MLSSASRPRPPLFIAVAASLLLLFLTWSHLGLARQNALNNDFVPETVQLDHNFGKPPKVEGLTEQPKGPDTGKLPCAQLPGSEDVFVVMKTSATEVHEKLPTHLETTFRCIPNFAIFSDYEEEVQGQKVYDVLDEVNETLRKTHTDFSLYRQLHEYKSKGKDLTELADLVERQGLKLDKWKFLPLMEKALKAQPEAKYYFFMEADTYIIWSNLLQWLQFFDPQKPLYIGGQNWMLDKQFASGGSGIILSKNSLERVVAQRRDNLDVFDKLTAADYAGDVVLARAMETVAVPLTGAFPILQGENPYTLDYTKNHWCYPVVSYHHMKPEWTKAMWDFEQSWMSQGVSFHHPFSVLPNVTRSVLQRRSPISMTPLSESHHADVLFTTGRAPHPPSPRRLRARGGTADLGREGQLGQPVGRLRGDSAGVHAARVPRGVRAAPGLRTVPVLARPVPDRQGDTAGPGRIRARSHQPGRRRQHERLGRRAHQQLYTVGRALPAGLLDQGGCDPTTVKDSIPFSLFFFSVTCIITSVLSSLHLMPRDVIEGKKKEYTAHNA